MASSSNEAVVEANADTATASTGEGDAATTLVASNSSWQTFSSSSTDDAAKQAKRAIAAKLNTENFYCQNSQHYTAGSILLLLEAHPGLARQKFPFYWKPQEAKAEVPLVIFLWHNLGLHNLNRLLLVADDAEAALRTAVVSCSRLIVLAGSNSNKGCWMKSESLKWLIEKCTAYRLAWKELEQAMQQYSGGSDATSSDNDNSAEITENNGPFAMRGLLDTCGATSCSSSSGALDKPETQKETKRSIVLIFNEDPFYHPSTKVKTAQYIIQLIRNFPDLAKAKFPFFWLPREKRARAGTCLTIFLWNNLGKEVWNDCLQLQNNNAEQQQKQALLGTVRGLSTLLQTDHCTLAEAPFVWVLEKCQELDLDPSPLINALLSNREGLRGQPRPLLDAQVLQTILELEPAPSLDFAVLFKDGHSLDSLERVATRHPLFSKELVLALAPRERFVFCPQWARILQRLIPQLTSLECGPSEWTLEGWILFLECVGQSNRLEKLKIKTNLHWVGSNPEACAALKDFFAQRPPTLTSIELVGDVMNLSAAARRARRGEGGGTMPARSLSNILKGAYNAVLEGLRVNHDATGATTTTTSRIDKLRLSQFNPLPPEFVAQLGQFVGEMHLTRNRVCIPESGFAKVARSDTPSHATAANNNTSSSTAANNDADNSNAGSAELEARSRAWWDVANQFDVIATYDHHATDANPPSLGALSSLTLKADSCAGYFDKDVTRGILGVIQNQPIQSLEVTSRFTHGRYGSRHSHRLQVAPFCRAIQTRLPSLKHVSIVGLRIYHDHPSEIPDLLLEATQNSRLDRLDICNGKKFFAWDQVPYLKDDNFCDYRTAVKIWCACVVRRYRSESTEDLLTSIVDLPRLCYFAEQDKNLLVDIRRLRVCKNKDEVSGKVPWIEQLQDDSVLDPFISPIYELLLDSPNLWCNRNLLHSPTSS